jgi:hypothetical protein
LECSKTGESPGANECPIDASVGGSSDIRAGFSNVRRRFVNIENTSDSGPRRFYTSEAWGQSEALTFFRGFGVEPALGADDKGANFLEISIPDYWSLSERRDFHVALAAHIDVEQQPCDKCGDFTYQEWLKFTYDDEDDGLVLCGRCLTEAIATATRKRKKRMRRHAR